MTGAEIGILSLLTAQTALQGVQGHAAARQTRKQAREARAVRKQAEKTEEAKAALLKQGVQEQATELVTADPFADTGGVPLSVRKRLTFKSGVQE